MTNTELKLNVEGVQKASEQAIQRALEKIGGTAEGYAVANCPTKTGNLKNSITHEIVRPGTVAIGTNVTYAPFVELGHIQEPGRYVPAIGKRLKAKFVNPKAFLRPAIENHKSEYENILQNELRKG